MNGLMGSKTNFCELFEQYFGFEFEYNGPAVNFIFSPNVIVRAYLRTVVSTPTSDDMRLNVKLDNTGELSLDLKSQISSISQAFPDLSDSIKGNVSSMLTNMSADVKDGNLGFGIRFITTRNMVFQFSYVIEKDNPAYGDYAFEFVIEIALNDIPNIKFKKPAYEYPQNIANAVITIALLGMASVTIPGLLPSLIG